MTRLVDLHGIIGRDLALGILSDGPVLADRTREQAHAATSDMRRELTALQERCSAFLPERIVKLLGEYLTIANAIAFPAAWSGNRPITVDELSKAFRAVVQQVRRELGTERLTEQSLRAIGVLGEEEERRKLDNARRHYDDRLYNRRSEPPGDSAT